MATTEKPMSESMLVQPPVIHDEMPSPDKLLAKAITEKAPEITKKLNIFPIEWRVETPRLMEIYEASRDPGWSPSTLPWSSFNPDLLTQDQRYAISYWWALLSVFDASGPAVFARAMIHAYEKKGRGCHSQVLLFRHARRDESRRSLWSGDSDVDAGWTAEIRAEDNAG